MAAAEGTARRLESLGHHVDAAYPSALDDEGYIELTARRYSYASVRSTRGIMMSPQ